MPDLDTTVQLACPSCGTQFRIARAALGSAGRDVRCSRCSSVWRATAPVAEPMLPATLHIVRSEAIDAGTNARPTRVVATLPPEDAPPLVPHVQPGAMVPAIAAPLEGDALPRPSPRRPAGSAPARKPRRLLPRPATAVAAIALVALGGLYAGRQHVVRIFPGAATVFAMAGIDVNLRGMTFANLKTSREVENGVPVLLVDGVIRSSLEHAVDVPRLRLGLRDGGGQELYSWTAATGAAKLEPFGTLPFRARLASPPATAASLEVRFLDKTDMARPH